MLLRAHRFPARIHSDVNQRIETKIFSHKFGIQKNMWKMLKMVMKKKNTAKDAFQGMTVHGSEVLPWDTVTAPPRRSISLVRMHMQDKNSCFIFYNSTKKLKTH